KASGFNNNSRSGRGGRGAFSSRSSRRISRQMSMHSLQTRVGRLVTPAKPKTSLAYLPQKEHLPEMSMTMRLGSWINPDPSSHNPGMAAQSKRQNVGDSWLLLEFTERPAYDSPARGSENSMSEFSGTQLEDAISRFDPR